jgi:Spy/CpxP family protein refolding chaperone
MIQIVSRNALKYGLITAAIFGIFVSVGSQLQAQPRGHGLGSGMHDRPGMGRGMGAGMGGMGGGMGHQACDDEADITNAPMWQKLELSAEQQSEIQSLHATFCVDTASLRDRAQSHREMMHDQFASDASRTELESHHQEMVASMNDLHDRMFTMMLDVRDVLTPEQREQLSEMMDDRMMGNPDMMDDVDEDRGRFRGAGDRPMMRDRDAEDGGHFRQDEPRQNR